MYDCVNISNWDVVDRLMERERERERERKGGLQQERKSEEKLKYSVKKTDDKIKEVR